MDAASVVGQPAYTFTVLGRVGTASCNVTYEAGTAVQASFDDPNIDGIDIKFSHFMQGNVLVVNVEINLAS